METPERTRTDPLLTGSISSVKSAKVDNLRKCCENLGLVVGSSGRRNQRVKNDYVTAILTHRSRVEATHTKPQESMKKRKRLQIPTRSRKRQRKSGTEPASNENFDMPFVNMTSDAFKERDTMTARIQKRRADDNNDPRKHHKPEDEIELLGHATELVATGHLETLGIRDESPESEADTVHSDMSDNVVPSVARMEDTNEAKKTVLVRLFENARNWQYIRQASVRYNLDGDLDLHEVTMHLNITGGCRVIDPVNGRPFYLYNGNIIEWLEVQQLLEQDGYLRIVPYK